MSLLGTGNETKRSGHIFVSLDFLLVKLVRKIRQGKKKKGSASVSLVSRNKILTLPFFFFFCFISILIFTFQFY